MTFDDFVGLPWRDRGRDRTGCDCWGLLRLVYQAHGVTLPCHVDGYRTAEDREAVAALIAGQVAPWTEVRERDVRPLDGVLMREGFAPRHIGLVVRRGQLLHVEPATGTSVIESYGSGWLRHRIVGFYRHEAFA